MWVLFALLLLQTPDHNAEGIKALEAQKYDQAEQHFQKAVEADAKDYGAWFHLALAQSLLSKDTEAIAGYRKVLELKPGLYEAELNLGIVLLRQKQPDEAARLFESALEKKPAEQRPKLYLADATLERGRALAKEGKLEQAAPLFRKAAEHASFRDALLELASLYEAAKQNAEAIEIYKQFPENPAAKERLGELLLESGQAEAAIPELEAAVKESPTTANRVALAAAYIRSKQADKATPLLARAVEAEPLNLELRMMYGRVLRDRKQLQAAAQQFAQAAQAKPDHLEAWSELASILIVSGNYEYALAALDRVKALGGENAAYYYFRAIVLDRTKQYKPALESYRQFLVMSREKHPDEEFKARQRIRVIEKELSNR